MALITCRSCGKQISDKAKACPGCGAIVFPEGPEAIKQLFCTECGSAIPSGLEVCPNCGCPVETVDHQDDKQESPQKVEITAVNLPKMKKKTQKGLIIAAIILVVAVIGTLIGVKLHKDKQAEEAASAYKNNLNLISFSMITGGAKAEEAGNLIKSVWYNAIYEERDNTTDKYTRPDGFFVDDFNDALANLFADTTFTEIIEEIKENQKIVSGYMKDLKNPPEGFEDAYSAVKDCYDIYLSFTNMVINPSGSLQTFSSNFNDADTSFVNKYNALKLYLEE